MSIEVTKYDEGCWQLINKVVQVMLVDNSIWWQTWELVAEGSDVVHVFEEMEGKSCVWVEDDVVTAVGICVLSLCLNDSGASNF
ncbi:hypothetical protein TNCV_11501 [Trichonephila clavipes]|nr:hypothetical protein TNCV_11501 [Trichonephila clavipes]